jgi:hypothetical protein
MKERKKGIETNLVKEAKSAFSGFIIAKGKNQLLHVNP